MEEDLDCPLCMEEMDITDRHLKPCHCGYQICVWCWHQVMENAAKENTEGRCPACRTPYDKDKVVGTRLSCSELEFTASKRKSHKAKSKTQEGRKHLSNVRVVQRNLVYIVGFPVNFADEEMLERRDFFGQYGKILKVAVSRQHSHNGPTASVYVTFVRDDDAVKCINAIDGCIFEGKLLRACFGTNKYCNSWLKNLPCNNPDCLYLHDEGPDEDSYTKEEMIAKYGNKIQFNDLTRPPHRAAGVLPPPAEGSCSAAMGQSQQTPNKVPVSKPASSPVPKLTNLPPAAAWGMRDTPAKTMKVEPQTDSSQESTSPVHAYRSSMDSQHDGDSFQEKAASDSPVQLNVGEMSISLGSDLPNGHALCSEILSPPRAESNMISALERLDLGVQDTETPRPSSSSSSLDPKLARATSNEPAESNIIADILTMDFSEDGASPGDLTKLFLTGRTTPKPADDFLESPLPWKPHGKQQSRFSFARQEDIGYEPSTSNQHALESALGGFPVEAPLLSRSQSISSADPVHTSTMKARLFAPPGFSGTSVPPPGFSLRSSSSMPPSPAGGRLNEFDLIDPAIMAVGRSPLQNDISRTMRLQHKAGIRQFFPPTDHGDVGALARQYDNPLSPYSPSSARNYRAVSTVDNSWVGGYSAEALAKFKRGGIGLGSTGVPNSMRPGDGDSIFSSNRNQAFDHYMSEQSFQADIQGAFV
ncbi:CCR4-NOT transcription complex subunit 4 isoform X1 [Selaginella moellendorffii]|uniref:CCR4-NOT transcription complex subunit 4 isoform X1 n=1 Tax=Selaginella moellendorffii TaxID=88036 RepID=UPI000D1CCA3F|nr:CCR4-NOT transcription complex subunit 4 isoform X1 [Selaginella moellendorffii]XP_024531819.1 CCR4-NOT transcription complex subunit 4 isoform X1 [Selaginella moellendorffii]XP_024531821.1 CCR4-NOT transcription complex subunit 4 isoform X1 [Selaginella moellendorffii]|eukprot:XP_002971278.2 CCR4-NOT transcription complex subunit 4 isoform X1 [Selaginella moellendorffii]